MRQSKAFAHALEWANAARRLAPTPRAAADAPRTFNGATVGSGTPRFPLKERRDELRPLTSLASPRLVAARRHTDTGTPRWLKVSTSAPCMSDACGRCRRRVPDAIHACPRVPHASTVCV